MAHHNLYGSHFSAVAILAEPTKNVGGVYRLYFGDDSAERPGGILLYPLGLQFHPHIKRNLGKPGSGDRAEIRSNV